MSTNYDFLGASGAKLMTAKVTLDPASALYATADAAYTAFCNELGIDPSTNLGAFDGDDEAYYNAASVALNPAKDIVFKNHHMIASEGGIGFYDTDTVTTTKASVTIANTSRMYQTTTNPCLFITYHASGMDGKSYNSKWNKSAAGFCVRVDHSQYTGATLVYKVAIQVTPQRIRFFFENVSGGAIPIYVDTFAGAGSSTKTVLNQYSLGNTGGNGAKTFLEFDYNSVVYKSSGHAFYKIPLEGIVGLLSNNRIDWTADVPANTTLAIKGAVNGSDSVPPVDGDLDVLTSGGSIPDLTDGLDTTGLYLWLKAELGTSDTSKTPSLTALSVTLTDDISAREIAIHLTYAGRLKHPQGNVSVAYVAALGNIKNAGGTISVSSFTHPFDPDEAALTLYINPNDPEQISVGINMTIDVGQIVMVDAKSGDENLQVGSLNMTVAVYDTNSNPV